MSGRGIATRYVDLCVPLHTFVPATFCPWVLLDPNHEHGDGAVLSFWRSFSFVYFDEPN
jgi:hypothetical protein